MSRTTLCGIFAVFCLPLLLLVAACEKRETVTQTTENGFREEFQVNKKTGDRDGYYKKFRPDGSLIQECTYRNGKLDGKLRLYYASGKRMQEETYRDDVLEGTVYAWYESGGLEAEENYVNSQHEGPIVRYYENGKVYKTLTMKNGVEDGPVKIYWPNGNLQEEGEFHVGIVPLSGMSNERLAEKWHGERKMYDENGQHIRTLSCEYSICRVTWQRDSQ